MAPRPAARALALVATFAAGHAQTHDPTNDPPPGVRAELLPAQDWSWQCDPIRCALRVTNAGAAADVRPRYSTGQQALLPFEVEHATDAGWEAVQPSERRRADHPARFLTAPSGRELGADGSCMFEVDLWDLDAVSSPGRIRVCFALEVGDPRQVKQTWTALLTPWVEIEIRAHAANARVLLADDASELQARYDALSAALSTTQQTARNKGPVNPGPGGPGMSLRWERHAAAAEQLVADQELSSRLRARARLVLAYGAVERAVRARDEVAAALLRTARTHLEAIDDMPSPPSGGLAQLPSGSLEALRIMLAAYVDGRLDGADTDPAAALLRERYPFFAATWRSE